MADLPSRPVRPAAATAAAVLTFVQFGLLVVGALGAMFSADPDVSTVSARLGVAGVLALGGFGVLGGVALLRGISRQAVRVLAWIEVALIALGTLALAAVVSGVPGLVGVVVGLGLVSIILPATRAALVERPAVEAFVVASGRAGVPRQLPRHLVLGVTAAVALLAVLAVVLDGAGPTMPGGYSSSEYNGYEAQDLIDPAYVSGDPTYDVEGRYLGTVPEFWDDYDDGDAVVPPTVDDAAYMSQFTAPAVECWQDDMSACDTLFSITPSGTYYEWLGATCGGRLDYFASGGCVDALD